MTTASLSDPLVGRVLDGRYEILSKLARGGMATVYRAQDRRLTRIVAVKVMHDGLGDDQDFARKFDREARSAATLSNPHVVSVFDQGIDNGRPFIVMEFVQGCTLRHIITREAPLPPLRALDAMEDIVSALASAHDAGLVHRDVKPENVLISDRGEIKVADFGLARAVTSQTATATQGLLIGTVSYLPPELVTTGRADARSDVYSAGVVLFEMLTGKKPHQGETPIQVAYSHVHNDIPAPSSLLSGNDPRSMDSRRIIPPYLDALVMACTRREPGQRPVDGRELLQLVRTARKALGHGILDDPALTAQMRSSIDRSPAARPLATDGSSQPHGQQPPSSPASPAPLANAALAGAALSDGAATVVQDAVVDDDPPTRIAPAVADWQPPQSPRTPSPQPPSPQPPSHRVPHTPPPRHEDFERRRRTRRRRAGLLALLLLLVLALAAGTGAWWFVSGRYEATPDLVNQRQTQAVALAKQQGLAVQVNQEYSETVPKGVVIRTEPEAGGRVLRDTSVEAWVSKGPERYLMPSVVGMNLEQARKAVEEVNLTVGKVTDDWSDTVPEGIIATVSQPRGTELKRGTPIDFVVSKGPQPVEIKDFTGKAADKARTKLQEAGFTVNVVEKNSDDVDKGKVIVQNPNGGEGKRGDTITLEVSKGPVMVQVPRVAGSTEAQATQKLEGAGFGVKVVHATPEWLREDKVKAASPSEGSMAKQGAEVTLWVI
ncbi:Stk1 family PASTA domain-containing Ser/Thr kinase [Luteococcus sp. OSA5]|uniref:Stk1 family PASTA domain-containing Ser/Thr kinase n=1 Tax=Luteococcus sp. OSA5 TaxID=3401630 RepID=UPI003B42E25F